MIKKIGAKIFANYIHQKNQKWIKNPLSAQQKTFDYLIQKAKSTDFGRDHEFYKIKNYQDFQALVPIRDYEGHRIKEITTELNISHHLESRYSL